VQTLPDGRAQGKLVVVPELPDVEMYVEALAARVAGRRLERIDVVSPFLVRTFDPPLTAAHIRSVRSVQRMGKRIVLELEDELFLALHLMIAGRLHWADAAAALPKRTFLATFVFDSGSLGLTEAGSKRRAALHLVRGEPALRALDRGGIEPLTCGLVAFAERLRSENHTLKRALTDPRLFSGIGNAYSDEILHCARLSPLKLSRSLDDAEIARLHAAVGSVLNEWTERLRTEAKGGFPRDVTAFRPEMAVHGRYRQPCPVCNAPVQRIVHASNESNYCAGCQTGGRLLADRVLSRLLKDDWPASLDEL